MSYDGISELVTILRGSDTKILDASAKLSLTTTLLHEIHESINTILEIVDTQPELTDETLSQLAGYSTTDSLRDLKYLQDLIPKTLALKVLPNNVNTLANKPINLALFTNIRALEVHRVGSQLIRGLHSVRSLLWYITFMQSVTSLRDVLETCGGDRSRGDCWRQLKHATFRHNSIDDIDGSLEYTPLLELLDLSHNRIRRADIKINCLPNLEYLNLAWNKLVECPEFAGSICNRLRVLNLRSNLIDDISQLSVLVNLAELDLAYNCLLDHYDLLPVSNLPVLESLILDGNPLSYHSKHRKLTASYLHINTITRDFLLDSKSLTKEELHTIGVYYNIDQKLLQCNENSTLINSCESIVARQSLLGINNGRREVMVDVHVSSSDQIMDVDSDDSSISVSSSGHFGDVAESCESAQTVVENCHHIFDRSGQMMLSDGSSNLTAEQRVMQDSGFVAGGFRPVSPSDSIGTATSLGDENSYQSTVISDDSDIEVLSNPSESSIEVLSTFIT